MGKATATILLGAACCVVGAMVVLRMRERLQEDDAERLVSRVKHQLDELEALALGESNLALGTN